MSRLALIMVVALCGCSKKDNNTSSPDPDAGASVDSGGGVDGGTDAGGVVSDRELRRSVPLAAIGQNRLEDPLLTMQNDSWFAVTSANTSMRVLRVFEPDAPNDGTIVGVPPTDGASSCLLGRMKWGEGMHQASVWVDLAGAGADELLVDLVGIRLDDPPEWSSVELSPTSQTHEGNGRTWTRWEVTSPERYGWGYFEVCSAASDTVFITGPEVVSGNATNALVASSAFRPAAAAQIQRVQMFDAWWQERRAQSDSAKSRLP